MNLNDFDPNGIGHNNGRFIGLPFTEKDAKVVLLPVPWDVTTSYRDGTSLAPCNILKASLQLDLYQHEAPNAWKNGIYMRPPEAYWLKKNNGLRLKARKYIDFIENGGDVANTPDMQMALIEINNACKSLNDFVFSETKNLIEADKLIGIVGGEHSVPLGYLKALNEKFPEFGILQLDAHKDLRQAYEGFKYSHASILYNTITENYTNKLVQVGVRDFCDAEVGFANKNQVITFYDEDIKANLFKGITWHNQCQEIIAKLPRQVYISFDIDVLNPQLCPGTGTPVPGGLEYSEAMYLIKQVVKSGRKIIGFDLCEVGGNNEWDGNVGARVLYGLCCWALSNG